MRRLSASATQGDSPAFADGLPAHDHLSVKFLLAVIDSWDGTELMQVLVDGNLVFSNWFQPATGERSRPCGGPWSSIDQAEVEASLLLATAPQPAAIARIVVRRATVGGVPNDAELEPAGRLAAGYGFAAQGRRWGGGVMIRTPAVGRAGHSRTGLEPVRGWAAHSPTEPHPWVGTSRTTGIGPSGVPRSQFSPVLGAA